MNECTYLDSFSEMILNCNRAPIYYSVDFFSNRSFRSIGGVEHAKHTGQVDTV